MREIPEFLQIIDCYDRNFRAANFYLKKCNFDDFYISSNDVIEITATCHNIINSPTKSLINIIEAFDQLLQKYKAVYKDKEANLQRDLDFVTLSTSIMGVFGIIREQQLVKVETDDQRNLIHIMAKRYQIEIDADIDVINLGNFLSIMLQQHFNVRGLMSVIHEMENRVDIIADRLKYPTTLFYINRFLLENKVLRDFLRIEKLLTQIDKHVESVINIVRLNITSMIITRGLLPSEVDTLREMLKLLSKVNSNEFYYDGIRLNKAIYSLFVDKNPNALEEIINLAEKSTNYSALSSAQRIILKLSTATENENLFLSVAEKYRSTLKTKGFYVEDISKENINDPVLPTPVWYFLMLPAKLKFMPFRISPWGNDIL